jgi:two-component system sensor histidine kinase VicK
MEHSSHISDILTTLIVQSNQVYFIFDPLAQEFVFLNDAFYRIWGTASGQHSQKATLLQHAVHPDDRQYVAEGYRQLLAGEKKQDMEFRIVNALGIEKWLNVSVWWVEGKNNKVFLTGTAEDISGIKQYLDNLQKFGAKKNSVLEILSHDLAGPLNVLQNLAGLVATKVKSYEDQQLNELIHMMIESCKRNVKLIREFVSVEFLESSAVVLNKQRINIVERFKQIIEEYKYSEEAIAKTFHFQYSNEPLILEIDDMKFMQIINNLVSNAIKFTPDNGAISLHIEEKEHTVLFTVADDGIGIPADLQPVLFDKFSKARRPGLRGEESTGLGMSIIKNLVSWHGGKIWFKVKKIKALLFT